MSSDDRCKEIVYLILTCCVAGVAGVLSSWLVWNHQNINNKLEDILFLILPNLSRIEYPIPNYIAIAQYILGFISFEFDKSFKYLGQFLFLQSIVTILRSITISLTILPTIHLYPYCNGKMDDFFTVFWTVLRYGTCGDYMYSGHTASSMLVYLFVHRHGVGYIYEILSGLLLGAIMLTLLIMRWHYSVDILIAVIIIWMGFKLYKVYETSEYGSAWFYFNSFVTGGRKKRGDLI